MDIPVSTTADLNRVGEVLARGVRARPGEPGAWRAVVGCAHVDGGGKHQVDTVTLRMVARTLPGKQFEAGRQLRVLVVRALARAGIVTAADAKVGVVGGPGVEAAEAERKEYEKTHEPVQR